MKKVVLALILIVALTACQKDNIRDRLTGQTTEEDRSGYQEDVPEETTIEELTITDSDVENITVREGVVVASAYENDEEGEDASVDIIFDEEDDSLPPIKDDAESVPRGTVVLRRDSGFRIQLVTVTQKSGAEEFGRTFKEKWDEAAKDKENDDAYHYRNDIPIYVEFYDPYWKLRVGNYKNRSEAEYVLKYIKKLGYGDAWIVPTTILIREES